MAYRITLADRARKDLGKLPHDVAARMLRKLASQADGSTSDVKRLTNHTPEYRLRVGDYRILFEIDGDELVVHRIGHRRDIYR